MPFYRQKNMQTFLVEIFFINVVPPYVILHITAYKKMDSAINQQTFCPRAGH